MLYNQQETVACVDIITYPSVWKYRDFSIAYFFLNDPYIPDQSGTGICVLSKAPVVRRTNGSLSAWLTGQALDLSAEATTLKEFKDWWWKARLGKCYYKLGT